MTFAGPLYGGVEKDVAYRMARGLILPSYTEDFGGVVIDALAFGLPVLTSAATPWKHLEAAGCGQTFALDSEVLAGVLRVFVTQADGERREGRALVEARYTWDAVGWDAVGRRLAEAHRTLI